MLVKLAKLGLNSKRTWQTVYCAKTRSLSHFGFGKLSGKCNPRDFKYYLDKINNKIVNFVHLTIKNTTLLKCLGVSIRVSRKIDLPRLH